jgi:hypothetical protein
MKISPHPGPSSIRAVLTGHDPTRGPSLRTTQAPTFHRRRSPRLGPRSLDPDRSFWSAYAELIRGQMPPTDFCKLRLLRRAGTNPSSRSSLGRWPRPPSGSDSEAPSPLRERFRAAIRAASDYDDPVAGSSHLRGFARPRYRRDRATTERVAPPVCSDDRRARVRGPREGRSFAGAREAFLQLPSRPGRAP